MDKGLLQAMDLFKDIDENDDGKITFKEFQRVPVLFPRLFFPIFHSQYELRESSLGTPFYTKKMERLAERRRFGQCEGNMKRRVEEARLSKMSNSLLQEEYSCVRAFCIMWCYRSSSSHSSLFGKLFQAEFQDALPVVAGSRFDAPLIDTIVVAGNVNSKIVDHTSVSTSVSNDALNGHNMALTQETDLQYKQRQIRNGKRRKKRQKLANSEFQNPTTATKRSQVFLDS